MSERITLADARAAGYCAAGIYQWFRDRDLDYRAFARHGIDVADIPETDRGVIDAILRAKEARDGL